MEASLLVERDVADGVTGAVDATTATAVMATSKKGEDGGACWGSAARGSGIRL